MPAILRAGFAYFAVVLGTGFIFGMFRVPWLVPRIGERWAELAEMPFMAVVIYASAGWLLRRYAGIRTPTRALAAGFLALALSVAAELGLATVLQNRSLAEFIASRDKVSGSVYLALLLAFAVMPWLRLSNAGASLGTRSGLDLGVLAGRAVALLSVAYAVVLGAGLFTLPPPTSPIQDPWFTAMELLILALAPAMVAFAVGLQAWSPEGQRPYAQLGIVFMGMCAVVTSGVHFAVLTLSRQPAFDTGSWQTLVFAFRWPSVVYALDILAWDVFFPLAALCAALAIPGPGLAGLARRLLYASAALAFIGLAGLPSGNMDLRNIGILGYVVLYPIAAVLLAIVFRRGAPV